jgi:hypothetical protein
MLSNAMNSSRLKYDGGTLYPLSATVVVKAWRSDKYKKAFLNLATL